MVVECAGSLMGPLAAVVGGDVMLPSLPPLISPLMDRLVCSRNISLFSLMTEKESFLPLSFTLCMNNDTCVHIAYEAGHMTLT